MYGLYSRAASNQEPRAAYDGARTVSKYRLKKIKMKKSSA